jgi:predicted transcriptional regulator
MVNIEERKLPKELVSKVEFVDYNSSLSEARKALKSAPALVVTKDGDYFGLVDSRVLTGKKSLKIPLTEKIGKLAVKAPKVSDSSSVEDLAYYFFKLRTKSLPYMQSGKITGVVERGTLLKMLLSLHALEAVKVSEVFSAPILAIDSSASLVQAHNTMQSNKVNRLVVLDEGRFTGLITNSLIHDSYSVSGERLPEMKSKSSSTSNVSVSSVMEKNVKTISPTETLAEAARMMVEEGAFSLVVTKGRNPIGILTISDILESVISKRSVEEKKVFLSGFDEHTFQYEESVREELKSFMHHIEAMRKLEVDYLAMRVKTVHLKSYEMQARISMGKNGMVRVHSSGESFHEAFHELMKRLKGQSLKEKDELLTERKNRKGVLDE